ncbi:hypothetical protein M513_02295 [Trichuris suis]|uniref:CCHC-type domain-containing protein n=1 Tax=Trichuris suis TaxID=68888 RepID=A0A085MHC3_9BILA|nr:hypothetical protein M513_02295 [Trichuris suis]
MLRDRLVCGAHDEGLQRRLLAEPSLTLKNAQQMAIAYESAQIGIKELRCSEPPVEVGLVSTSRGRRSGTYGSKEAHGDQIKSCYRCKRCHDQWNCQFKNVECRFCGKKGHIERACRLKEQGTTGFKQRQRNATNKRESFSCCKSVRQAEGHQQRSATGKCNSFNCCQERLTSKKEPVYDKSIYHVQQVDMLATRKLQEDNCTTVWLNDVACKMEVDSGSAFTLISEDTFQTLWPHTPLKLEPVRMILRDYQQRNVPILWTLHDEGTFRDFSWSIGSASCKGQTSVLTGPLLVWSTTD